MGRRTEYKQSTRRRAVSLSRAHNQTVDSSRQERHCYLSTAQHSTAQHSTAQRQQQQSIMR